MDFWSSPTDDFVPYLAAGYAAQIVAGLDLPEMFLSLHHCSHHGLDPDDFIYVYSIKHSILWSVKLCLQHSSGY